MHLAFILGRTPRLAVRELERAAAVLPFEWSLSLLPSEVALLTAANSPELGLPGFDSVPEHLDALQALQRRLGGTVRIVQLVGRCGESQLIHKLTAALKEFGGEGKLTFGLSAYGAFLSVERLGLSLKSNLKQAGRSVRFVMAKEGSELSSAQIGGNKLVGYENGIEIVLVRDGDMWLVGRTVTLQDIEDYRKRDFDIPVPDPVSGMLSPKLAQTMVNLAVGADMQSWVYDPFCGNGRIVEEAAMMGLKSCGSDILEKQAAASAANLAWIAGEYSLKLPAEPKDLLWKADATLGGLPKAVPTGDEYYIVTEPYLGVPLRSPLQRQEERQWEEELANLYRNFFTAWSKAPKDRRPKGFIVVFPAAKRLSSKQPLSIFETLVDRLRQLGYSPTQVSDYGRPDAFVVRQIIRLDYA